VGHATEDDLSFQAEIALEVAEKFKCKVNDYCSYSDLDYWIERDGKLVAFMEVKRDPILNFRKINFALHVSAAWNVPTLLFFKAEGRTAYAEIGQLDSANSGVFIVGSRIVKSKNDIEPAVRIKEYKFL